MEWKERNAAVAIFTILQFLSVIDIPGSDARQLEQSSVTIVEGECHQPVVFFKLRFGGV